MALFHKVMCCSQSMSRQKDRSSQPLLKAAQLRDKEGNAERLITAVVLEIKFWGLVKAEEAAVLHS